MTVERSVTFIPEEVDVRVGNAPVEGEMEDFDEILEHADKGNQPIPQPAELENIEHSISPPHNKPPTVEDDEPEAIEPIQPEVAEQETGGRGKRIRKESGYVRRIREGEGRSTNWRNRDPAIPKGIQLLPGQPEELRENAEMANEKDIEEEDWAMAAVMDMAEYLNPSYEEAKRRPDWPKWQEAIKAELESLEKNGTWSTVKCPKGANVVSCKWVLRIKKNAAGKIEKYKAWLVV